MENGFVIENVAGIVLTMLYFALVAVSDAYFVYYYNLSDEQKTGGCCQCNRGCTSCVTNALKTKICWGSVLTFKYIFLLMLDGITIYFTPPYLHAILNVIYPLTFFLLIKKVVPRFSYTINTTRSIFGIIAGCITLFLYIDLKTPDFSAEDVSMDFLVKNEITLNAIFIFIAISHLILTFAKFKPGLVPCMVYKPDEHKPFKKFAILMFNIVVMSVIATMLILIAKVFLMFQLKQYEGKHFSAGPIWVELFFIGAFLKLFTVSFFDHTLKIWTCREQVIVTSYSFYVIISEATMMSFFNHEFDTFFMLALAFFFMSVYFIFTESRKKITLRCCKTESNIKNLSFNKLDRSY